MRPRRYYQYIEKGDTLISGVWKILHVFCFVGIVISSLAGARAFCEIFDIFNYRCVLYAKVSTKLTDIEYKNQSDNEIPATDPNKTLSDYFFDKNESENKPKLQEMRGVKLNLGIFEDDYNIEIGVKHVKHRKLNFSNAIPVEGVPDMFIFNDELWLNNDTMVARAHVVMTTTVFATLIMCDFVIFTPFLSLIVSAVFTFIVLLFSRTGRKLIDLVPAAWTYIYPLIITASTMTILAIVSFNLVYKGLNAFCARFVHLTGQQFCSPLMDYFTKEQKLGRRDLYMNIKLSQINYFIVTIFWIAQLLVTLLRVICSADFQMTSVLIMKKAHYDDNDSSEDEFIDLEEISSQPQLVDIMKKLKKQPKRD